MSGGDIRERVLAAMAEAVPGAKLGGLDPARPFRDQMEMDSIDFLNFALAVERAFGIRLPETDFPQLSTLDGCIRYLKG